MERKKLESAAAKYSYLRGLFGIPVGLLAILSALGNWEWGPLRHTWIFLGAMLVLAVACLLISRYYNENYGRVTLSIRQQMRVAVVAIIGAPVFFGASLLARSRADWSLDLPVNPTAALFALLILASVAVSVGLRAHHVIIWGAVLVAGLRPSGMARTRATSASFSPEWRSWRRESSTTACSPARSGPPRA